MQEPLPKEYQDLSQEELDRRILAAKKSLGNDLIILGHHYQRDSVVKFADFRGDSYKLCKLSAQQQAKYIVFCGVHFMAEAADILGRADQIVVLPDLSAGCTMADMANLMQVEKAWQDIHSVVTGFVPITYVNSTAALKAFVGKYGGSTCTSSNAEKIVKHYFSEGKKIFFFPDQHLGRWAALQLGIGLDRMIVWDPFKENGGNTVEDILHAQVILWKGHCSVHQKFSLEDVEVLRSKYSGIKIISHPECTLDVLQSSDYVGSTELIINTIKEAEPGSTWAVGTEIHLVNRLAKEHPDKNVMSLATKNMCLCGTMYRISTKRLLWVLENLVEGRVVNQIVVDDQIKINARKALDKMVELTSKKIVLASMN